MYNEVIGVMCDSCIDINFVVLCKVCICFVDDIVKVEFDQKFKKWKWVVQIKGKLSKEVVFGVVGGVVMNNFDQFN